MKQKLTAIVSGLALAGALAFVAPAHVQAHDETGKKSARSHRAKKASQNKVRRPVRKQPRTRR